MRATSIALFLFIASAGAEEPANGPRKGHGGFSVSAGVGGGVTSDGDGFLAPTNILRLWGIDTSHFIVARPELTVSLVHRDAAALIGDARKGDIPQGVFEVGFFLGWTGRNGPCGLQLGGGFAGGELAVRSSQDAGESKFPPGRFDGLRAEPGLYCQWDDAVLQLAPFAAAGFRIEGERLSSTVAAGSDLRLYVGDRFWAKAGFDWESSIYREPSVRVASAFTALEGRVIDAKVFDITLGANVRVSDRSVSAGDGAVAKLSTFTFGLDAGIGF